ncbi:MAG: DNA-deoxyinosine glycosylase [Gammaproteobacteria bacterium]|nr:DNA-deoxyinosine glycosylase [Gammaproteobacteria bacterium]
MAVVKSFPPIIGHEPKILVLGSSPGVISVKKQQYFAHSRNVFWPIMAQLFGIDISQGYENTVKQFEKLPIALWDCLKQCNREGSLDSAIDKKSLEANDFVSIFEKHPTIHHVFCNGGLSFQYFNKLVLPTLSFSVKITQLPSTSPAHAAMGFQQKLEKWQVIKASINSGNSS